MRKNIISKAYIIRNLDSETSVQYANDCQSSCDHARVNTEYVDWPSGSDIDQCWKNIKNIQIKDHGKFNYSNVLYPENPAEEDIKKKAESITLAHVYCWNKICESGEAAAILEHDFKMYISPYDIIPDNYIVGLGYKLSNPDRYRIQFSEDVEDRIRYKEKFEYVVSSQILGAHGYAITPLTAKKLLKEVEEKGIRGWIDDTHFQGNAGHVTNVPTCMMNPPPGVCHVRESTIWPWGSQVMNAKFTKEFLKYLEYPLDTARRVEIRKHHLQTPNFKKL